ncbi:MAG: hypothetical protein E6R07_07480 [Nevskiaceae bacterium]|nr:MAG: hypothetical protein E6R07_07480 [Nevskiaceae bacterium]
MLRRLIIAFLVFASLTSQVSVAFACGMMGSAPVVVKHCCCEHESAGSGCDPFASGKSCCQPIVEIAVGPGEQIGDIVAPIKLPNYDPQPLSPALLPVPLALALSVQSHVMLGNPAGDHGLYGTDLYLRTQRLRI